VFTLSVAAEPSNQNPQHPSIDRRPRRGRPSRSDHLGRLACTLSSDRAAGWIPVVCT
jgi:hypothetical protein